MTRYLEYNSVRPGSSTRSLSNVHCLKRFVSHSNFDMVSSWTVDELRVFPIALCYQYRDYYWQPWSLFLRVAHQHSINLFLLLVCSLRQFGLAHSVYLALYRDVEKQRQQFEVLKKLIKVMTQWLNKATYDKRVDLGVFLSALRCFEVHQRLGCHGSDCLHLDSLLHSCCCTTNCSYLYELTYAERRIQRSVLVYQTCYWTHSWRFISLASDCYSLRRCVREVIVPDSTKVML